MPLKTLMKQGIHHIGFVVRSVNETIEKFEDDYGITGFTIYEFAPQKVWSYGDLIANYKLKIAMLNTENGCTIEIVEPIEGTALHSEFLEQGNKGFHHVCFSVDNFDYWKEKILAQGKVILFECETEDDSIGFRRGLFSQDTELDMVYEIKEIPYFRGK